MSSLLGIVLAAGRSSRAGFPKALAVLDGETLVARTVRVLEEAGTARVVVVVAPPHDAAVRAAVPDHLVALNPAPEHGMTSSLQVGLRVGLEALPDADAVVFALVDHPEVRASTVAALVRERAENDRPGVRPTHASRGGHPVVIARRVATALLAAEPSATLRDVLTAAGGLTDVATGDAGVVGDLDTPEELAAIGAQRPVRKIE